ncbi:MAG TPA: hypothetical protein VHF69_14660 [Candidatus Synoicihabitans sp.]|nr:hypothetical protein [Candidatus Synoicihabitans sp.]
MPTSAAKGGASEAARQEIQTLELKNLSLLESVRIVDDEIRRTQQLKFERTQRTNAAELTSTALGFDQEINKAVAAGNNPEAERLHFTKEIALIEKQIAQAKRDGDQSQRVATLEAQRNSLTAQRTADRRWFAEDATIDRERNRALAGGKPREAQAAEDFKAQRDLIQNYLANGLTEAQARSDFRLSIAARDRGQDNGGPRVSVDASQAVGLGGNSSAGSTIELQRRQTSLLEVAVQRLTTLVDQAGRGRD